MNKIIIDIAMLPLRALNLLILKKYKVRCGNNLQLDGLIGVRNEGNISIGDNCFIRCRPSSSRVGQGKRTFLVTTKPESEIRIGNHVGMSHVSINAMDSIIIEDDVVIGGGTCIWDSDFHSIEYEHRNSYPDIHVQHSPVLIKKGVWIGGGSIILKGVTIGECSVIGAGSVVTKNVPPYEVWAGNPARFIRKV